MILEIAILFAFSNQIERKWYNGKETSKRFIET